MKLHSLVDEKKREALRAAIRRGDYGALTRKDGEIAQNKTGSRAGGLAVFIKNENGVPMEEAIRRAGEAGVVMASNKRMAKALDSREWVGVREGLSCWTGTMVAYEEPEKAFGKIVEYTDDKTRIRYVFPVPNEFVGVKNGLLVVEQPDFTLEIDGNDRIVKTSRADLIEKFPSANINRWYLVDSKYELPYGVPYGDLLCGHGAYLDRIAKRVGLLVRYGGRSGVDVDLRMACVCANDPPSNAFGVVVESPETDASK